VAGWNRQNGRELRRSFLKQRLRIFQIPGIQIPGIQTLGVETPVNQS